MNNPIDSSRHIRYRALVATCVVAAVVVTLLVLFRARHAVLISFAGVLLALGLSGLARQLARLTRLPRASALAFVCVVALGVAVGLCWWVGPRLATQFGDLSDRIPAAIDQLRDEAISRGWSRWPSSQDLWSSSTDLIAPTLGVLRGVVGVLMGIVLILFLGIYLAAEPQKYLELTLRIVPIGLRGRLRGVLEESGHALQKWLVARAICMFEVGGLTMIGLSLLGIDVWISLGILAGLLNFVPNFGPIAAAIPAVLIGFLSGPGTSLWILLLYLGVQAVDNYVVGPLLTEHTVSLPAAIGLAMQMVLGIVLGPLGILLAMPLTVVLGVFIQRLYIEGILNNHAPH